MAEIFTSGMALAARAWVWVMLPEPIRPMWVVMEVSKIGKELNAEATEVKAQRTRRDRRFDGNMFGEEIYVAKAAALRGSGCTRPPHSIWVRVGRLEWGS